MSDNKNIELNDEMMAKASGGTDKGAPEPKFHIGDRVIVSGKEDCDSVIKQVHFTGDIVNNSWEYLVHMVHKPTGLKADAYYFESRLSLA